MTTEDLKLVDMSHQMVVRCTTVDTRNWSEFSIESSEFLFQGVRFKLKYSKYSKDYRLFLYKFSGVACRRPFQVDVTVEIPEGRERIVSVLRDSGDFTGDYDIYRTPNEMSHDIWWKSEEEILQAVPEFRGVLTLLVVLEPLEDHSTCTMSSPSLSAPCLEGLSQDFSQLLDGGPNPDVEFQCGGQSTWAHAAVVSARSRVIARMLATDMVEGGTTRVIKIPEMGAEVFGMFLRYLYTGKLDGLTLEVALGLIEAGNQYAVTGLAKRCSEYVADHLSVQRACDALVIADAYGDAGLAETVVEFMVEERVPVKCNGWPGFCDAHPRLATKVLNRALKYAHY